MFLSFASLTQELDRRTSIKKCHNSLPSFSLMLKLFTASPCVTSSSIIFWSCITSWELIKFGTVCASPLMTDWIWDKRWSRNPGMGDREEYMLIPGFSNEILRTTSRIICVPSSIPWSPELYYRHELCASAEWSTSASEWLYYDMSWRMVMRIRSRVTEGKKET